MQAEKTTWKTELEMGGSNENGSWNRTVIWLSVGSRDWLWWFHKRRVMSLLHERLAASAGLSLSELIRVSVNNVILHFKHYSFLKNAVVRDATHCTLVAVYRRFWGTCGRHGGNSFLPNFNVYTMLRTPQSPYSPTREIQTSQKLYRTK